MIIIVGKSGSGKDSVVKKLTNFYDYKKIVTWTTRPMRPKEIQDVTYHFTDEETFEEKIEEGFFAEWKKYESIEGTWYYGTALLDLTTFNEDKIIILTPDGYQEIKDIIGKDTLTVYLKSKNRILKSRLKKRGDNPKEIKRRLRHDKKDFKGIEKEVDVVIENNKRDLWDIAKMIEEMDAIRKENVVNERIYDISSRSDGRIE
ncbi:guanylate kinase [Eubacterium sp. BX4]|uniref:Guanylate kinase n=1 Tax=Eubacterium segne TaxID=2763045 RepID=A0ABR7F112_9FIRM|nr:guanylate kinase [Eubacterium segne]MBC5667274.1 guanylate kinase [Eubacterium segne]